MLELEQLSRIGFGSYRVSVDSPSHLVDTSSNYENTRSESLIGYVLSEHPKLDTFVITKAGYIQGDNLAVIAQMNRAGSACGDLISFFDDDKYLSMPTFSEGK